MTAYVLDPPPVPAVPVLGEDARFPVRRILCVGRNYAAHRREMGGDDRDPPFFFAKPADALALPGADVPVDRALDLVFGYGVGFDLTRRDLQAVAKEKGHPWDASKGFDQSAPISAIRRWSGPAPQGRISATVNGQSRQDALVSDMIWNVAEIIAQASKLWALAPGDLIFTGTPEGVGPIARGDQVEGAVEGVGELSFRVV